MEVTKFEREDWFEITDPVEVMSDDVVENMGDKFFEYVDNGVAVTVREEGQVTTCGGIAMFDDKCGGIWIKVSKKATERPFRLIEAIKDSFDVLRNTLGDVTIIAHVRDGFTKGEKMARFFGFQKTEEFEEYNGDKLYVYIYKGTQ